MVPQLKKPDVEVLGWCNYRWLAVVRLIGQLSGKSSGGYSGSEFANCTLPQLETSVALCCDKTAHFKVVFYCPQLKVHLYNDHAVQLASSYATPVDGLSLQRRNAH
jgi:hypothetical protein